MAIVFNHPYKGCKCNYCDRSRFKGKTIRILFKPEQKVLFIIKEKQ